MDIFKAIPSFIDATDSACERPAPSPAPLPATIATAIKVALDVANEGTGIERQRVDQTNNPLPPAGAPLEADPLEVALTLAQVADALALVTARAANHRGGAGAVSAINTSSTKSDSDTIAALCTLTRFLADHVALQQSAALARGQTIAPRAAPKVEIIGSHVSARGAVPLQDYLDAVEKCEILAVLEAERHNKTAAARTLGVTFRSLRYRLERLEIE